MEVALTTKDNPYDPFDQYTEWMLFDHERNYCTAEYIARIANTSDSLTDAENKEIIENAIDEIIKYDLTNNYVKIRRN